MPDSSTVQFKLNLPVALKNQLVEAAERSGRSLTAEVISRLQGSLAHDEEYANALDNIDDLMSRLESVEGTVQAHDEMLRSERYEWK